MNSPGSFIASVLGHGDDDRDTTTTEMPAVPAEVVPAEQAPGPGVVARARLELAARPGSLHHGARHGQLASRHQHAAYVKSRAWAKGPWSQREGALFYALIGTRARDLGLLIAWIGERQYRFWAALIAVLPVLSIAAWLLTTVLHLVLGLG